MHLWQHCVIVFPVAFYCLIFCAFDLYFIYILPKFDLFVIGSSVPMPPELMELYQLYQQELATRNEKEANYLSELNVMLRVSLKIFIKIH